MDWTKGSRSSSNVRDVGAPQDMQQMVETYAGPSHYAFPKDNNYVQGLPLNDQQVTDYARQQGYRSDGDRQAQRNLLMWIYEQEMQKLLMDDLNNGKGR